MAGPFLSRRSIVAWEKESTRGSAPSTGSAWQPFGRVTSLDDFGPQWSIFRDPVLGAGIEAHEIGFEGKSFGPTTIPAFQVRDPRVLGFAWSQEVSRTGANAGFFRHELAPKQGQLDSFATGIRDRAADGTEYARIFLECIMPRLSMRGEAIGNDGSGGRFMAAPDVLPHDDTKTDATNVTVNLGTAEPYRWYHGRITLDGTLVARLEDWEFTLDRRAEANYYWRDDTGRGPDEAPAQEATADFRGTAIADGATYTSNNETFRDLLRNRRTFDIEIRAARTVDEDEVRLQLTDVVLSAAPGSRQNGQKVSIGLTAPVRQTRFEYVDANDAAFFST